MSNILYFVLSLVIYMICVIIPIVLYINKKENKNVLEYLRLKNNICKGVVVGASLSFLFIISLIIKNKLVGGSIKFDIGILWISGVFVGIVEEIPFRGFLLRLIDNKIGFWKANFIVTIIFVLLHYPNWITSGTDIVRSTVEISAVSLCFGYLVNEYDSLWISIICHSVFNICFWMGL